MCMRNSLPEADRRPNPPAGDGGLAVSHESFAGLRKIFGGEAQALAWRCAFTLPCWIEAWWDCFGSGEPLLLTVRREGALVGAAALMISGNAARPIGDPEVCDHFDIAAAPGEAAGVLDALRRELLPRGVTELDLIRVRPDSIAAEEIVPAARRRGLPVEFAPREISMELDLPASWEEYLQLLAAKPRHELRRKLRRLAASADYRLRLARTPAETAAALAAFFNLFRRGREDKARFMTPAMERFFTALAAGLAAEERLRLFALEIDGETAAVAFCCEHAGRMLLYNNAYDERRRPLSPGLLSKALSLRASIEGGLRVYDFLRGDESYKQDLGGRPVPLYSCRMALASNEV